MKLDLKHSYTMVKSSVARRRPARKNRMKRSKSKTVSKPLKRAIDKLINKNIETKYVATTIRNNQIVPQFLEASVASTTLFPLMPNVYQGDADNQRIGDQIRPIRMRAHVDYVWHKDCSGAALLNLRQFHVGFKPIRSAAAWQSSATQVVDQAKMLKVGDGTTVCPDLRLGTHLSFLYPLNTEVYTAHKGCASFRMAKNSGCIQDRKVLGTGDVVAPGNGNTQLVQTKSFDIKVPKVFKYNLLEGTPNNFTTLFGACFGVTNNLDSDVDVYGPIVRFLPTNPPLIYNVRVELWYKDA